MTEQQSTTTDIIVLTSVTASNASEALRERIIYRNGHQTGILYIEQINSFSRHIYIILCFYYLCDTLN